MLVCDRMRILWHSDAPWHCSGYGRQTAIWARLLRSLGHEVAISAFHGLFGAPKEHDGITVYPGGDDPFGMDVLAGHYRHFGADLVITLLDLWAADPQGFMGLNAAHWMPVDCAMFSSADKEVLSVTQGRPVAMSRHGEKQIRAAGFDPLYVPHGIDTQVFVPPRDRQGLRRAMGLDDRFVIGVNAANQDGNRKGLAEQFRAFARFRTKHKDALLFCHTRADNRVVGGIDLTALARECGIAEHVRFCSQYEYRTGLFPDEAVAQFYGCLDVLSNTSWGEGFGLPIVEAQACGVPVVVTRASSMPELCGAGWMVGGEPYWHARHEADWVKPDIAQIVTAYQNAYAAAGNRGAKAREFALRYDMRRVLKDHWVPALEELA